MDRATAREEAAFFAETPGQALTYQIGKTQLIALLADADRLRGAALDLQAVHDYRRSASTQAELPAGYSGICLALSAF